MNPFARLYRFAINQLAGTAEHLAYGLACNIDAEPMGATSDWLKLSPYFEGDYWAQEGGQMKKYRQVVSRVHADRIVTAFNAFKTKQGTHFRGLPIYRGHPDYDKSQWPNEERLGGVMEIEARDDGLYVRAAWNDAGEKNRAQGYLVYPSPAWPYDEALKARTGRIEPVCLRSVGMTNTPRILESAAWTNSDPSPADHTQPTDINMDLKKLAALLGLDPATATEETVAAAIKALKDKTEEEGSAKASAVKAMEEEKTKVVAANSAHDATKLALNTTTADVEKFRKLAINSQLDGAINAGKLTAAEKPAFEQKFATNYDDAAAELAGKGTAINTDPLKLTKRGDDISTPAGRRLAFNARIDELTLPSAQGGKGLSYAAALNAMRANAADAALLKAMGS